MIDKWDQSKRKKISSFTETKAAAIIGAKFLTPKLIKNGMRYENNEKTGRWPL